LLSGGVGVDLTASRGATGVSVTAGFMGGAGAIEIGIGGSGSRGVLFRSLIC
jgi:hypothetical protein